VFFAEGYVQRVDQTDASDGLLEIRHLNQSCSVQYNVRGWTRTVRVSSTELQLQAMLLTSSKYVVPTILWWIHVCYFRYNYSRLCHFISHKLLFTVPFIRTELAQRAFRCAAPSVWNSLPSFIINSSSLTTFKSRMKTYFFGYLSTVAYTSDLIAFPPAPLKLRPNGAI